MLIAALTLLLPAALPAAHPTPLLAQTAAQPGLAEQQAAFRRATVQAQAARKRSEDLEARATLAGAAADRHRDQAAALAARIQQSEADLRAGEARLALTVARQRDLERSLAVRRQPIVKLIAALQQIARRAPITALIEPGPVGDAVHRRLLLAQALPVIMARTRALRADIARSADLRRGIAVANAALARSRANLVVQRRELAVAEQRLRLAARAWRDTAGAEADRALAMGEAARDIGELLGHIEAAGAVRDALMALPGPTLRPDMPGDAALPAESAPAARHAGGPPRGWRLPVVGDVVAGFGERLADGTAARGLTVATVPAATVVAPANGRVAFAGPFRGYGQILIVEHGGGWTSLVARLDRLTARVGDEVRAGDPVGSAGPGHPRILVELRKGDAPVDIAALIG